MKKILISPSLLSADFSCLADEIKRVESAGADMLHIDVMDGHFVPNITIGPQVVKDIRKVTRLPLDVHLMIERPFDFIDKFVAAGSDMITVHIETVVKQKLKIIKQGLSKKSIRLGISLNPDTPLARVLSVLDLVDFILVMTVRPGFGGQRFMAEVVPKIKKLRAVFAYDIAVDGGIDEKSARTVIAAGATILAAGSYIFKAKDTALAIRRLRNG